MLVYWQATPNLVTAQPGPGQENVAPFSELRLVFSREMDPQSVAQNLQIEPAVAGEWAWQGKTLGSPIALLVANRDYKIERMEDLERPRPGHGDLSGSMKYLGPIRAILERASQPAAPVVPPWGMALALAAMAGSHSPICE